MKSRATVIGVIIAIVCLVAVLGVGGFIVLSSQPAQTTPSASSQTFSEQTADASSATAATHANKLDGATETTDANGVVHGTTAAGVNYVVYGRGETTGDISKVTFSAVGDSLGTDNNLPIARNYGGGDYDFTPFYQEIGPVVQKYDLRFINQETAMAGTDDGRSYSGYPIFNSPDSMLDAIAAEKFNIVNFGSNHTWDMGSYGIERTQSLFAAYPEIMLVGSYDSEESRETVHMIERNGTTFAVLSYVYGDNSYAEEDDFPNTYYSCPFNKDRMQAEIERAQQVADAVIVYMHWGSEYVSEPNDQQEEYAQFLADLNVDLVIGSHAHITQPARYVEGASGNKTLVVYGLSDFLSGWTLTDTILSGLFTCDFVWENGSLALENPVWHPLIEWSDGGDVYIRLLENMTDDEIAENTRTDDVSDDVTYLHDVLNDMGFEIPIAW